MAEWGENRLIERLKAIFSRDDERARIGIGDDGAIVRLTADICASVDSIEAGVDWLPSRTPRDAIGHRAAAVSLSDLAAMGAEPSVLLLALEVPTALTFDEIEQSAAALHDLAIAHGATVVGGDVGVGLTERWTVTAIGEMRTSPMLRSAARAGDHVWLIGEVGMAAIGLAALRSSHGDEMTLSTCIQRHLRPIPRCQEALVLQRLDCRLAAIDISDGLVSDAKKLASASGVQLQLELSKPSWLTHDIEQQCASLGVDWRQSMAAGGDDYALLVCAPPSKLLKGQHIGTVTQGDGVTLKIEGVDCSEMSDGWQHK